MKQNKILYVLIIVLVIIIFMLKGCNNTEQQKPKIITKTTVSYKYVKDTIVKEVPIYKTIKVSVPKELEPSTNIDSLRKQFLIVRDRYIVKNVYSDTIKLDTLGYITVTDTVQFNRLLKRTVEQNYKIPTITKEITIIKPPEPYRALYYGGELFLDKNSLNYIAPGLIYKTKKDRLYKISAGINLNGQFSIGAGTYFKF